MWITPSALSASSHRRVAGGILIGISLVLGGVIRWWAPGSARDPQNSQASHPDVSPPGGTLRMQQVLDRAPDGNRASSPLTHPRPAWSPSTRAGASSGLSFNGVRFAPDPEAGAKLRDLQARLEPGASQVVLLGLASLPTADETVQLTTAGVKLLSWVPESGYLARVSQPTNGLQVSLAGVEVVQPLDSRLRIRAVLRKDTDDSEVPVYVHLVSDRDGVELLQRLAARGFTGLSRQQNEHQAYLAGKIPSPRWAAFLAASGEDPDVQWVEPGVRARPLNESARRTLQSGDFLGPVPFYEAGIYGSNQVIAVCDTGIDMDSCYFREEPDRWPATNRLGEVRVDLAQRKVIAVDFLHAGDDPTDPRGWDNHGHGTGVAGCAAGSDVNAPLDPDIPNGMAPGAKLIIQDAGYVMTDVCADLIGLGCPVTNFLPVLLQAQAQGATIHNNSWGDREDAVDQNTYSQPARELDLAAWNHRDFLVVCAAGNSALPDLVGSPSVAKNGLSVGATQSGSGQDRMAFFSSRGWASDGRLKPDLVAPGQGVHTAGGDGDLRTRNCNSANLSGTSFSSPLVAGMAALVRDYFAQGFYPDGAASPLRARPSVSSALVKAVLINSTVSLLGSASPPPARDQGWGRVNLSRSLPLTADPSQRRLWVADVTNGFARSASFPRLAYLRARAGELVKVTLVWTDYPATAGVDRHLVNDLDLRLRSRHREFKGNEFSAGLSASGAEFDRINNVEQILVMPQEGEVFELSVWSHRIIEGPQPFAVVVTGAFEPIPGDRDADGDGLPDGWELFHTGDLSFEPQVDPDHDGVATADEYAANSHPLDPGSRPILAIESVEAESITLRLGVSEGRRYRLETAVLPPGGAPWPGGWEWTSLPGELLAGQPMDLEVRQLRIGRDPADGGRLYRVRIESPDEPLR